MEGISDNENEPEPEPIKQEVVVPIVPIVKKIEPQEPSQEISQPPDESLSDGDLEEEKSIKNETKNIPKNYGKAIIIFIEKNRDILEPILVHNGNNY